MDAAVHRGWRQIGRRGTRVVTLVLTDVLVVVLSLQLAGGRLLEFSGGGLRLTENVALLALLLPLFVLCLGMAQTYGPGADRQDRGRIVIGALAATGIAWAETVWLGAVAPLATGTWILFGSWALVLLVASRSAVAVAVGRAYRSGWGRIPVVLLGTEADENRLRGALASQEGPRFEIVERIPSGAGDEVSRPGSVFEEALLRTGAEGVLVGTGYSFEAYETIVHKCFTHGVSVTVVPRVLHGLNARLQLRRTRTGTMLQLHPPGLRVPQLAVKRALDIWLSCLLALVTLPLWVLIAIAIKLDSPGPIFFRQERAGLWGKPFRMYKFRTMYADADSEKRRLQHLNESSDPRLFKIRNDPRVTRVGRLLRQTSLDELPQLINVVAGQMSLVGPRPFFVADLTTYEEHHFRRLSVLPGITGLWQVSGRSEITDFEEVVHLDATYIEEWSVSRDLLILARTLPAAFGRGGAY